MARCAAAAHSGDRWRRVSHRARAVVCRDTGPTGTEAFLEAGAARRVLYSMLVPVRASGATASRRSGGSGTIACHLVVGSQARMGELDGSCPPATPRQKTRT